MFYSHVLMIDGILITTETPKCCTAAVLITKDKKIVDRHLPPSLQSFVSRPVLTLVYIGPYTGEIRRLVLELRLEPLRSLRSS